MAFIISIILFNWSKSLYSKIIFPLLFFLFWINTFIPTLFDTDILSIESNPIVHEEATINEVILEISKKRLGATAVIKDDKLKGLITDGDLRRMLEIEKSFSHLKAKDIMSLDPHIISSRRMAYDAFEIMQDNNISQIVIMDNNIYVGIVHMHEILKSGVL